MIKAAKQSIICNDWIILIINLEGKCEKLGGMYYISNSNHQIIRITSRSTTRDDLAMEEDHAIESGKFGNNADQYNLRSSKAENMSNSGMHTK